jgi:hypothetical protein
MTDPTLRTADDKLAGASCPYCRFPFKQGVEVVVCGACGAPQHADCWNDNGGCAVVACEGGRVSAPNGRRPVISAAAEPQPSSTGKRRRRDRLGLSASVAVLAFAVLVLAVTLLVGTRDSKTSAPRLQPVGPTRSASARPIHVRAGTRVHGWPKGFAGYTVALASDLERSDAVNAVSKARSAGLPSVGVLVSANYASLAPGYLFVFSGVYGSATEAAPHVSKARRAGFSDAYVRRVAE